MDYGVVPAYDLEDQLNVSRYLGDFSADLRRMRSLGRELLELGAICKDSCCGATPKGAPYVEEGGIPLLRGTNVKELGIVWDGVARFICEDTTKLGRRLVQDNDVLLSMSGNAGVVCFAGILPEPCSLSNTVMRISFDEQGQWDPRFVALFLKSRFGQAQFEKVQSGMAQKHVMPNTVRRVLVPYTSMEEQHRIIERYEELSSIIGFLREKTERALNSRERIASLIDRAFSRVLSLPALPNYPVQKIIVLDQRDQQDRLDVHFYTPFLVDSEKALVSLPGLIQLESLLLNGISIASGATPKGGNYPDDGIPFIRVQNVREMKINLDDIVYISSETHKSLERSRTVTGDVLFTITGSYGFASVFDLPDYGEANMNQHVVRLRFDTSRLNPYYAALFLNSSIGFNQSKRHATGRGRPALDFKAIASFLVPVLDMSDQDAVVNSFHEILPEFNANLDNIRRVQLQAQRLMGTAKRNIFSLLDREKYETLLTLASDLSGQADDVEGIKK